MTKEQFVKFIKRIVEISRFDFFKAVVEDSDFNRNWTLEDEGGTALLNVKNDLTNDMV
jgi:hypothetical protein